MDFKPLMPKPPVLMDPRIFAAGPMELRDHILSIPLEQRFTYDETTNHFFVNLERFALRTEADIERIRQIVTDRVAPLGKRVYAIVNYDNFTIDPALLDEYSAMVRGLDGQILRRCHALHDVWFPPHEARRCARKTRRRPAYLRERGRGGEEPAGDYPWSDLFNLV